jgi:hypothetical protein
MSKRMGLEMEGELERKCSKISLTEGEKVGLKISEGEVVETRVKGENCLVGKIWAEKSVNKEAFRMMLSRLWRLVGHVIFKELHDNLWLFEFSDGEDRRRVLKGRPWSFDRHVIVLKEFDGKTPDVVIS